MTNQEQVEIRYHASGSPPGKVQAISIMMLINGIINILVGIGLTITVIGGSFGLGLICAPVTILPSILGIFEIIVASYMLSKSYDRVKPGNLKTIAICEIVCLIYGNLISMVIGIIILVFLNDNDVAFFFDRKNAEVKNEL